MENGKCETEFDKVGIGTKETQSLSVKNVLVQGHKVVPVFKDQDKKDKIGDKVVLFVKHPDREDPIELSQARYLKGDKVATSGL